VLLGSVVLGVGLVRLVPLSGRETLVIAGGSMQPSIPLGAAVVLDHVAPETLRTDDVVSIRAPGTAVYTHRITRIVEREGSPWLETKGDANAEPDPVLVPASWVAGRVSVSLPLAGYLLRLLALPIGVLMIIGLGIALVCSIGLLESEEEQRGPRPVVGGIRRHSANSPI
jgi:signal peptidase I